MSASMSSPTYEVDIELENFASSSSLSSRPGRASHGEASEPLLVSRSKIPGPNAAEYSLSGLVFGRLHSLLPAGLQRHMSTTMSRFSDSKAAHLLERLETDHEPGLSNAQMFLTNHDLKPVEEARRKWGPWNFVGAIFLQFGCVCAGVCGMLTALVQLSG